MKKILITLFLATGFAGPLLASGGDKAEKENQKTDAEKHVKADTGLAVANSGLAAGEWRMSVITRTFQQAAFLQGSARKSLFFSPDNAQLRTRFEVVSPREIKDKITRKLVRKYRGYQIVQVLRYDDKELLYLITLRNGQEEVLVPYWVNKKR